jgi:hypothetical protein
MPNDYVLDWDAKPRRRIYSVRLEFKKQDCWLGIFWKSNSFIGDRRDPDQRQSIWATHLWVCLLPTVPIHVVIAHEPPIVGSTQTDIMECGRILIRCAALAGRWGMALSPTDVERGALAVVSDPYYRSDVGRVAQRWASDKGSVDDVRMVRNALDQLVQNDTAP